LGRKIRYSQSNNSEMKTNYELLRKLVNKLLKEARSSYFSKKIQTCGNDVKKSWRMMNKLLGNTKNNVIEKLVVNGAVIDDKHQIANTLNDFFVQSNNVLSDNSENNLFNELGTIFHSNDTFRFEPVTLEEITRIIKHLDVNKGPGYDGVSAKILKNSMESFSPVLKILCNLMFSTGIYPNKLKVQKIYPAPKKGPPTDCSQYRPIAIQSIFDIVVEKLMFHRLFDYLDSRNFFYSYQFGFRPGSNVTKAPSYRIYL
jgi:hypothetical protein